ncbi:MAG: metallophosphoesterase family protein [SAR324 cluster bacterium]|nr:metallophosphoesterase family protein [SAR324 cluster bacterium]
MKSLSPQIKNTINQKLSSYSSFPFPVEKINSRQSWAANRLWMENQQMISKRNGKKSRYHWYCFSFMVNTFQRMLRLTDFYEKGVQNAKNIVLREIPIYLPNLPQAFQDFSILHLSDLHLEGIPDLTNRILSVIDNRRVDLCVLTGDYRSALHGSIAPTLHSLKTLIDGIHSHHGFLGVLGNHDDCHMVNPMEEIGIRMLINENCWIHKFNERLQVIGTDDVSMYYTDQALHALEKAHEDCTIALVHSPELYDIAAQMGVDLYLCGHTHAGQICLPGGKAIVNGGLKNGSQYYRGAWKYQHMQGFTSSGVGTSGIPIRFNTRGEVLILRLRQGSPTFY